MLFFLPTAPWQQKKPSIELFLNPAAFILRTPLFVLGVEAMQCVALRCDR